MIVRILVLAVLCFTGLPVLAECQEDDPKKCATWVEEGSAAPYSGQLLTTRLAVSLSLKAKRYEERLKLEIDMAEAVYDQKLALAKKLHLIDSEAKEKQIQLLERAVREARPSFWEHPVVVAIVTSLATVVLFAGVEALVQR